MNSNSPTESPDAADPIGKVYLVGAGPGDPGLISVRGVECLRRADAVLFDYLVNPRIVDYAGDHCERISLGSHAQGRVLEQTEINQQMVQLAQQGKCVVRLKCGDPAVFARLTEELNALTDAKIPFEIVPGITAGFAASSLSGLPITDRESSSAVALVTGHEKRGKAVSAIDFTALAGFPGTLVIYMGTTTVDRWSGELMQAGKSADTPVTIVRRATFPDQSTITCTLGSVSEQINQPQKVRPPVVFIVGEVARPENLRGWFEQRPLFGTRIMVARAADQADAVVEQFSELGAEVVVQPAIEISDPPGWQPLDDAIGRLSDFDWIVFSSTNGVRYFFERLDQQGHDARSLGGVKIAAAGDATAAALKDRGLRADLVPQVFRAESFAEELASDCDGKRFLLVRASRGRDLLSDALTSAGAAVEQVVAYSNTDVASASDEVMAMVEAGRIDWVIASSSAIARSLHRMFGERLKEIKIASISPVTSGTLRELGLDPTCEAETFDFPGIRDAILRHRQADHR